MLYSLTGNQMDWLQRARDTEGGAYCGMGCGPEPGELVVGGAATYREVKEDRPGDWKTKPYTWTECYLVPTSYGLELLVKCEAQRRAELERKLGRVRR